MPCVWMSHVVCRLSLQQRLADSKAASQQSGDSPCRPLTEAACHTQAELAAIAIRLADSEAVAASRQSELATAQAELAAARAEAAARAAEPAGPSAELQSALEKISSLEASLQEHADQLAKATRSANGVHWLSRQADLWGRGHMCGLCSFLKTVRYAQL